MTSRLGLELGPQTIRAVHRSGLRGTRLRTLEIAWDPERPAEAVAALREHLPTARHVIAAVDLALLYVKRLELPPLPLAEKRRLLGLEPDRYFAVRGEELAFALREDDALVFAAREKLITAWADALAALGRQVQIEPAPIALTRALRAVQVRDAVVLRDGTGIELLRLEGGDLRSARRLPGDLGAAVNAVAAEPAPEPLYLAPYEETKRELETRLPGHDLREFPRLAQLDPSFLVAYGAALADESRWREALLTPELENSTRRQQRTRLSLAAVACFVAFIFGLLSADAFREGAAQRLDARLIDLRQQAEPALALQSRLAELRSEIEAVAAVEADRPDPLRGLLELSDGFPAEAWIRSVQTGGGQVEIDGYARDAAALIPLFENDPRFENVRFRSATSRTQIGTETYEYFSLALQLVR